MDKKKLKFAILIIISPLFQIYAQPLLSNIDVFDDFSTATDLVSDPSTGRGIYWWDDNSLIAINRNSLTGKLDVVMTQPAYSYTPFGVGFGDDNGAIVGGNPYTIDLSNNGTWSFEIENTGTEGLSVRVAAIDINNRMIDCIESPTIIPNANFGGEAWKYQTQIEVSVGQKITFEAGTPNDAGAGIINNCDFANGMWGDYGTHTFRYDYDLTKIKGINITVLNAEKNTTDYHNLALTDGRFSISNFRVGGTSVTTIVNPEEVKADFIVYPNPSSQAFTVKSEKVINNIELLDVFGSQVKSVTEKLYTNEYTFEINNLLKGIYYIKVNNKIQKVIIN